MREIKFRAWDKETKQMLIVNSLTLDFHLCDLWNGKPDDEGLCRKWSEVEFMQYVGLEDRNGVEIYEGDIVAIPYIDPMGGLHTETPNGNSKVGFENGQFVIYRTEPQALTEWCEREKGEYISNYGNLTIVSNETILEVIGNIYENPELLNNK